MFVADKSHFVLYCGIKKRSFSPFVWFDLNSGRLIIHRDVTVLGHTTKEMLSRVRITGVFAIWGWELGVGLGVGGKRTISHHWYCLFFHFIFIFSAWYM